MNTTLFRKASYRHALVAAAMAAGLGGTAGAAAADPSVPQARSDSLGAAVTDTAITAEVRIKLLDKASLGDSHITVTTTNGVVTLDGLASNAQAKSVAEATTAAVVGVKSIDDELRMPPRTEATAETREVVARTERVVSDSWITTEVKSEILADSVTKGFAVSVNTIHGIVILTGVLKSRDAINDVKQTAESVDGVKSVDTSGLTVADK